jgi:energy-coupling factor transport system substrate-specific component
MDPIDHQLRFFKYELLTGGLLWDTGRAITTSVLILITAPALLTTLKRAARRAGIER